MRSPTLLPFALPSALSALLATAQPTYPSQPDNQNQTYLHATALITTPSNASALQCWRFTTPASVSTDAGTSGSATFAFTNTTETVYTVIPPRFDGGTHRAPRPQYDSLAFPFCRLLSRTALRVALPAPRRPAGPECFAPTH